MNVKCPYCGCEYDINPESLPKPLGDVKLGYGWWLRCYKCHKKWWLKSTVVQMSTNTPIKADTSMRIEKLSKLKKKGRKHGRKRILRKASMYVVLLTIVVAISIGVYNSRESIKGYLNQKIKHLSSNMLSKLRLLDVQYSIENDDDNNPDENKKLVVIVSGKIINDNKDSVKLRGIKVVVRDEKDKEIVSWIDDVGINQVAAGEIASFSTKQSIESFDHQVKIDVSVLA
ncbi:MAG: hypothetical protein LBP31_03130 [Holosporales bacterium]|jgi:hypothetical protein|nr:hypothetical protein [Holosporales bacterium]